MRARPNVFVFLPLLSVLAPSAFAFDVYIETKLKNQPDFTKYGLRDDLGTVYSGSMFGKGQDKSLLPSKNKTTSFVQNKYGSHAGLLVLDIERWGLKGSDEKVTNNVEKYLTVLQWVKSAAPNAKVGYYARPPVPEYGAMQKGTKHPRYLAWQAQNDKLAPLADAVGAFFPGCYPNSDNQEGWVRKCVALVSEAKRLGPGKKIYPFINSRYHSKARNKFGVKLGFDLVPQDFFLLQLKTLRQHADGVVIWDLSGRPWNENEPWWQATMGFLGQK